MPNRFKSSSYSGNSSYVYIEKLIRKGRTLLIVSPYLDEYYARFLLNNSGGKSINILTSSIDKGAEKILKNGEFPFGLAFLVAANLVLDYFLSPYSKVFYYGLGFSSLLIAILLFSLLSVRPGNIRLKVPKRFVHAKMYISDDLAILGSVNLTYSGMHRNIEHIEIRDSREDVNKLKGQFWELWRKN